MNLVVKMLYTITMYEFIVLLYSACQKLLSFSLQFVMEILFEITTIPTYCIDVYLDDDRFIVWLWMARGGR